MMMQRAFQQVLITGPRTPCIQMQHHYKTRCIVLIERDMMCIRHTPKSQVAILSAQSIWKTKRYVGMLM